MIDVDIYLNRLRNIYSEFGDNDSLLILADVEKRQERARELSIYREQPLTQELIERVLIRYRNCVEKLVNPKVGMEMTEVERAYIFASMDWCTFILDTIGESPDRVNKEVEDLVLSYAKKAGI